MNEEEDINQVAEPLVLFGQPEEEPTVARSSRIEPLVLFGQPEATSGTVESSGVEPLVLFGEEQATVETPASPSQNIEIPVAEFPWAKYEGKSLTDEMILADPDLMAVVDRGLEARFGERSAIDDASAGILGGATGRFKGKSAEERLEIWNNWQRSLAAGQSVTTLNEVSFVHGASEEARSDIGETYMLFDQKGNIFTGTETWGETFDGVFDYVRAAVWDPVTLASFGVGKAMASGGTKAASLALRATAQQAFLQTLKQGGTRAAARQAAKEATRMGFASLGAKTVAKYSAVDFAANVGTDILYQDLRMDVGAQEEYSLAQTGVAALGTLAIPSLIAATKGVDALAVGARQASAQLPAGERNLFEAYVDVQRKFGNLGPDAIQNAVKQRVDLSRVNSSLQQTFQDFNNNLQNFVPWTQAKVDAGKVLNQSGIAQTAGENQNLFWKSFLFGDTTGTQRGFAQELADAGFVYVPRGKDDTITNFVADAMAWLDDATVTKLVSDFESSVGKTFDGSLTTAEELSSAFKNRQSLFGSGLADSRQVQDLLGKGGTVKDLTQALSKQADEEHAEVGQYVLSVWKRLVTSHPSTVGLNIKGWAATTLMNTVSDVVLGGLKLGEASVYKLAGKTDAYNAAINAAKGSLLGGIKRGYNILSPTMTMEGAEGYLMLKPELFEAIYKASSGGVDGTNVLKHYNIDPANKAGALTEKGVTALQNLYGVRLQDEITKVLSFQSALEQGIMREYGQTYNEFMARPDAFVEMFTPRFKERVDAWALNRTLRETASKNWSAKQGRGLTLSIAKALESASRNPVGGYAIPFGSFMNTAFATLGDYSGINAVKHLTARGLDAARISRTNFNFAEEEGMELFAKGVVGWGAVTTYFLPDAMDKLEKGLTWNQDDRDDGSIEDLTYDFPESYFRIIAQAAAHIVRDGEVPTALKEEMFVVLGGQPFRQLDSASQELFNLTKNVLGGEIDEATRNSLTVLAGLGSRIASGFTRPLDPVNQTAILMSDDYTQIDRKQASNKFLAESLRYVDQLFGGFEAPAQATPTRGYDMERPDTGRLLGGVRSTPSPNSIERMLASVGKAPWQAVQWDGDDQVKNSMDGIIGPLLNAEAQRVLAETPDFFDMPLASREKRLQELVDRSKVLAEKILEYSFSSEDTVVKLKKDLASIRQTDVKRAMDYLGFEGDPLSLAKEEGGLEKLEMLIFFSKNYNELLVE